MFNLNEKIKLKDHVYTELHRNPRIFCRNNCKINEE